MRAQHVLDGRRFRRPAVRSDRDRGYGGLTERRIPGRFALFRSTLFRNYRKMAALPRQQRETPLTVDVCSVLA